MDWDTITKLHKEGRLPAAEDGPSGASAPIIVSVTLSTGDQHGRFVDEDAWAAVLRLVEFLRPDNFVFNGDWTDFYDCSKYVKDPDKEGSVNDDFEYSKRFFRDIRSRLPKAAIHANPGNHEFRYELYKRTDAKKLAGLKILAMPKMMDADKYGVQFHGYDGFELQPGFRIYHGEFVRKHAGESARHEYLAWGCSGATQHVHRLGVHRITNTMGDFTWSEGGCLCLLNPEYVKRKPNWQHGATLIYQMSDGTVRQEAVRIVDGLVQGSLGMAMGDISR